MDIIDPVLQSSVEREKIDSAKLKSLFWQILLLIALAFVIWLAYSIYSSRLNTRPDPQIDVNPDLQAPRDNRRQMPISDTI